MLSLVMDSRLWTTLHSSRCSGQRRDSVGDSGNHGIDKLKITWILLEELSEKRLAPLECASTACRSNLLRCRQEA